MKAEQNRLPSKRAEEGKKRKERLVDLPGLIKIHELEAGLDL